MIDWPDSHQPNAWGFKFGQEPIKHDLAISNQGVIVYAKKSILKGCHQVEQLLKAMSKQMQRLSFKVMSN